MKAKPASPVRRGVPLWAAAILGALALIFASTTAVLLFHGGRDSGAAAPSGRPEISRVSPPPALSPAGTRAQPSAHTAPQATAQSARSTEIRLLIQQAIAASVRRDDVLRRALVDALRRDRDLALAVIEQEIARVRVPEHVRHLVMVRQSVEAP
jgi:hypothetical protein